MEAKTEWTWHTHRVHVVIWYMHRAQRGSHIASQGPQEVRMYVCMYVRTYVRMYVWMDGWMDVYVITRVITATFTYCEVRNSCTTSYNQEP